MFSDQKTNEWKLLKDQFDALVRKERVCDVSIEMFLDNQIRRRFGDWIARAAEGQNQK